MIDSDMACPRQPSESRDCWFFWNCCNRRVVLSRPKHGFESRWDSSKTIFGAFRSRQLLERQATYGGSKFLPVETKALRKQHLLKPLFLVETEFHPEAPSVRKHVLGEGQHSVYIKLLRDHVAKFNLGQIVRSIWPNDAKSEAITESCPRPHDPVESFAEPHHTLGPDRHSTRDVPLCTNPPVKEPDRFRSVDPKRRIVGIGVRPLQSCAAAGDEVGAAVRCGPEQQTPSERGFREVVMVAAEDVADRARWTSPSTTRRGVR